MLPYDKSLHVEHETSRIKWLLKLLLEFMNKTLHFITILLFSFSAEGQTDKHTYIQQYIHNIYILNNNRI